MRSLDAILSSHREPVSYRSQPVPKDLIETLLESSRRLQFAFYLQPTHYYVVTDDTVKEAIYKACFKQPLVRAAPAIIIFTGDRFAAREQEVLLDVALEENDISVDEAERERSARALHFDVSPLGLGWIGKLIGAPFMRLFTTMPQIPAVHKREFLTRQVMRSVMSFFWLAESHGLSPKIVDSYDEWRVKWALNIPWHQIVVSVMLVGYAQETKKISSPLTLDEVVHWNKTP